MSMPNPYNPVPGIATRQTEAQLPIPQVPHLMNGKSSPSIRFSLLTSNQVPITPLTRMLSSLPMGTADSCTQDTVIPTVSMRQFLDPLLIPLRHPRLYVRPEPLSLSSSGNGQRCVGPASSQLPSARSLSPDWSPARRGCFWYRPGQTSSTTLLFSVDYSRTTDFGSPCTSCQYGCSWSTWQCPQPQPQPRHYRFCYGLDGNSSGCHSARQ